MNAPTRRAVLAGASLAALPAAVLVPMPAAKPDADLIALCKECEHLERLFCDLCWANDGLDTRFGSPEQQDALKAFEATDDRQEAVMAQIANTAALTPEGLRAKAQACHTYYGDTPPDGSGRGALVLWSLVCDVAGRANT